MGSGVQDLWQPGEDVVALVFAPEVAERVIKTAGKMETLAGDLRDVHNQR